MKTLNTYIIEKLKIRKNRIKNYLRFEALENSNISLKSKTNPNIEYSFDGKKWIEWDYSDIKLDKEQIVYMRGDNTNGFSLSITRRNIFIMTGKIEASGNIMSLLYYDDFEDKLEIPSDFCFFNLFYNCSSLVTPPELPATKLSNCCYRSMFCDCTSLEETPELPATTLATGCYHHMFADCTSLVNIQQLPATILADLCYYMMFFRCKSLTQAPELPATNLTEYCYHSMFFGCTSLKQKPKIAADINNDYCEDMFGECPCENK